MLFRKRALGAFVAASAFAAVSGLSQDAEARSTIKNPGDHPPYAAELEPHGTVVLFRRAYHRGYRNRGVGVDELGAGFRASIKIMDPGFIKKINDTVAITFGLDVTNCRYCRSLRDDFLIWSPVALQWNFFLSDKWSVAGEVGGMIRGEAFYNHVFIDPVFFAVGRYHFSDSVSLTMRLGYPFFNIGVSFFVGD